MSFLFVCPCVRFGGDQPVYINIIRDPVSRFLSNYFFRRFGDWRGEQNHMIRTPSMRQEERYLVSSGAGQRWLSAASEPAGSSGWELRYLIPGKALWVRTCSR